MFIPDPVTSNVIRLIQMAHQMFNESNSVSIEHDDSAIFQLLPDDGSGYSILRQLDAKYYGAMTISVGMIPQFRNELEQLLTKLTDQLVPKLRREHNVTATEPAIAGPIIDGLLSRNSLYSILKQLLALCDDSLNSNRPIECVGD